MFIELKNSIRNLIFLLIIGLILFGLYNDAQQKQKERADNKNKYGIELTNKDLTAVEKEMKWQIDHPEKNKFYVTKGLTTFYFKIMNGPSGDPVTMGYFDQYFAQQIKEFQYKGYNVIIYIRR
jgi:hypothetical protein